MHPSWITVDVMHAPPVQVWPAVQVAQALPAVPQPELEVPGRQVAPEMQPVQQDPLAHFPPVQRVKSGLLPV